MTMDAKLFSTTSGPMLCLVDERGTIVGWIPSPIGRDVFGPGKEKVYLARPVESTQGAHRAA